LAPRDCQKSFDAAAGETRALMPLIHPLHERKDELVGDVPALRVRRPYIGQADDCGVRYRNAGAEGGRRAHLQPAAHDLLHHFLFIADELAFDRELSAGRFSDGRQDFVVLSRTVGRRLHEAAHLPLLLGLGRQSRRGDE
jgi:hypothetical protein